MSFLRKERRAHEREQRRERRRPAYHKPRWGLRGAVVGASTGALVAGIVDSHHVLLGAVVGAIAVAVVTVLLVDAAITREERLAQRDPKRANWRRREHIVVDNIPVARIGFTYWTSVGGDAPLTARGRAELIAITLVLVLGFAALATWSFVTR